jgi:hypothetical protein
VVFPGFAAGFLATLAFHQVVLALLNLMGLTSRAAFALQQTEPLGIPAVVSLAFWGGLWGISLACAQKMLAGKANYWILALALGAVAPTLGHWLVSAPLHGHPLGYGWHPGDMVTSILVNGSWGTGVAILLRVRFVRWAEIPKPSTRPSSDALNSGDHIPSPARSV